MPLPSHGASPGFARDTLQNKSVGRELGTRERETLRGHATPSQGETMFLPRPHSLTAIAVTVTCAFASACMPRSAPVDHPARPAAAPQPAAAPAPAAIQYPVMAPLDEYLIADRDAEI